MQIGFVCSAVEKLRMAEKASRTLKEQTAAGRKSLIETLLF